MTPSKNGDTLWFDLSAPTRCVTAYFTSQTVSQPNLESALLLNAAGHAPKPAAYPDAASFATLIKNLEAFSKVFTTWHPDYHPLHIDCAHTAQAGTKGTGRVGCFFTGGVDSFYTFLKHQREITDLIYVHGYDLDLNDGPRRQAISAMGAAIAAQTGVRFVEIETDSREWFLPFGDWRLHGHGLALGAAGRLLAGTLDKIYIAASLPWEEMRPWGSHPELDPLFSDEALQFIHDGCEAFRTQKVQAICDHPLVQAHLRVCCEWALGAYNCGRCEKCLRTMTSLYALGALSAIKTFPSSIDPQNIRALLLPDGPERRRAGIRLMDENRLQSTPVYQAWSHALNRSDFTNWLIGRAARPAENYGDPCAKGLVLGKLRLPNVHRGRATATARTRRGKFTFAPMRAPATPSSMWVFIHWPQELATHGDRRRLRLCLHKPGRSVDSSGGEPSFLLARGGSAPAFDAIQFS